VKKGKEEKEEGEEGRRRRKKKKQILNLFNDAVCNAEGPRRRADSDSRSAGY
jgi:hypothetical protein